VATILLALVAASTVAWDTIVEHIDHAVKIAGVDHVGLGSDFDVR
jgi:membrane dipeptidase